MMVAMFRRATYQLWIVPTIVMAAILLVAACSDEDVTPTPSSGSDEAVNQFPTVEVLVPTPSPVLSVTPTPTPPNTPTVEENARERCNGAANLEPLPESGSEIPSTHDPLELLRQSADAMSKLESFATTEIVIETFDDQSEGDNRRSPYCYLTQTKYEYPDRAASSKTILEARGFSAVSREQNLRIGESHYLQKDHNQLWRLQDHGFMISARSLLPFVMRFLLTEELPSEIETDLRLVGIEFFDGVAVYHVRQAVLGRSPGFRNVASFWIGVDDLLLQRAHWGRPAAPNHHYPNLVSYENELIEFHSFNEDFNIQPPPEDEIAE